MIDTELKLQIDYGFFAVLLSYKGVDIYLSKVLSCKKYSYQILILYIKKMNFNLVTTFI